jgi:hypothetical protein
VIDGVEDNGRNAGEKTDCDAKFQNTPRANGRSKLCFTQYRLPGGEARASRVETGLSSPSTGDNKADDTGGHKSDPDQPRYRPV